MDQEKCLPELMAEKDTLDSSFVHAMRLLAEGNVSLFWPVFIATIINVL